MDPLEVQFIKWAEERLAGEEPDGGWHGLKVPDPEGVPGALDAYPHPQVRRPVEMAGRLREAP